MNNEPVLNNGSDSEDSYEIVSYETTEGSVDAATEKMKNLQIEEVSKPENPEDKVKENKPAAKAAKVETPVEEVEVNTKEGEETNTKEGETSQQKQKAKPDFKSLKQRCFKFLKEVDSTDLKTVFIVMKTLIKENGSNLEDAFLTALSTVDRIYKHELIQDLIPLIPVYAKKIEGWLPVLLNLDFELILSMLPNLANCASKTKCGEKTVVDMRPFLSLMCPQKVAELEKKVPKNEERSFTVDPNNVCGVFKKAEKSLNKEFPDKVVHRGIICDVCDMNPIVGIRYKCAVRPNYDMCSKCVKQQPSTHPCIRIAQPVDSETPAYHGLHEFVQSSVRVRGFGWATNPHHGHHGRHNRHYRARGDGRRGCPWRRGCGRGDPTTFFGQQNTDEAETKIGCKRIRNEAIERKKEEFKRLKQEKRKIKQELKQERRKIKNELKQEQRKIKREIKDLKKGYVYKSSVVKSSQHVNMVVGSQKTVGISVKNVGGAVWNGTVRASFFKGHKDLIHNQCLDISVGKCDVGEETDIFVNLVAPSTPGEYTAHFMLVNDDRKFGKFHVTATVEKKAEAMKVEEKEKKTVKFQFPETLQQLKDMGYPDSEMLRAIVLANDGSVQRCVQLLVDTDMDMSDIYVHDKPEKKKIEEPKQKKDEVESEDEMTIEDGTEEDLDVDENPQEVESKKVEPVEAFAHAEGLKQLLALGFPDNDMLRAVLVANNGDVQRCVQLLLQ